MKKIGLMIVAVALLAWMIGCASGKQLGPLNGGGSGGGNSAFPSANWAFATTSGNPGNNLNLGGYLTGSGNSVTGHLFLVGAGSDFPIGPSSAPMTVSGSISGTTLTLTGTANSSAFTFTFTVPKTSYTSLSGNYSVTGGALDGDSGTVAGEVAGDVSGTWAGTIASSGGLMSMQLTEAKTPNTNGSMAVTIGATTFTGVTGCVVTTFASSTASYVAGNILVLSLSTTDQGISGQMLYVGVTDNAANPTSMSDGYIYSGGSSCMLVDSGTQQFGLTLTKQ